jgi:hypothetical protein
LKPSFPTRRSSDLGETWKALTTPAPATVPAPLFCSCDSDVDVAKNGRVYLTDFWISPMGGASNFVVQSSTDKGDTWSIGNPLPAPVAMVDRQYVLPGPGDTVYLAFAQFSTPPTGLWIAKSDDAGRTWTKWSSAAPISGGTFPLVGKPRILSDGKTLLFPYNRIKNEQEWYNKSSTINVARSEDGGATWKEFTVATEPDGTGGLWPVELAVNGADVAAVAWMARVGKDDMVMRASFSADKGATWSDPVVVSNATGLRVLPWIAPVPSGDFVVAYYGTDARGWPLALPADTRWDAWVNVVDPDDGTASAPVRASDAPVKTGSLCTLGASCRRGKDRELLDYLSVVADNDGRVHVAYSVSPKEQTALAHVASSLPVAAAET